MFKASRQPSLTTGTNPVENSFLSRGEVYIVGILHPVEPANLQSLQARESFGKVVRVSSKLRASLLQRGHRGFCRFQQGCQVELVGSSCRPHLGPSLPGVSAIFWALGFRSIGAKLMLDFWRSQVVYAKTLCSKIREASWLDVQIPEQHRCAKTKCATAKALLNFHRCFSR